MRLFVLSGSSQVSCLCEYEHYRSSWTHTETLLRSGTFPHYAARFVDPAFGFAVGINYFYTSLLTVPVEITAGSIILSFWDNDAGRQVLYTSVLIALTILINVFGT